MGNCNKKSEHVINNSSSLNGLPNSQSPSESLICPICCEDMTDSYFIVYCCREKLHKRCLDSCYSVTNQTCPFCREDSQLKKVLIKFYKQVEKEQNRDTIPRRLYINYTINPTSHTEGQMGGFVEDLN